MPVLGSLVSILARRLDRAQHLTGGRLRGDWYGFNPRPAVRPGATSDQDYLKRIKDMFQSSPGG